MKKNVAGQVVGCGMVTASDGSAFTGAVTVLVTGDAGTQATGSVGGGACTHEGNGYHTYAPAQAETNYTLVAFTFTGSGAIPTTVQVYTAFPQTGDGYAVVTDGTFGLSAIETLVDGLEGQATDLQARVPAALVGGRMDANVGAISSDATAADNAEAFFDGTGYAGTGNVIPTVTAVTGLTAATVHSDLDDIQARLPAALVSGRIDASVGAMAAAVLTASAIAADAITDAKVAADVTIASVTGAVGSVTGNIGGNVTGSVGSIATGGIAAGSFAAGAVDNAAIGADAIGSSELATTAVNEIRDAILNLANVEPTAVPAATAAIKDHLAFLFALARNRVTQTATTQVLKADDTTTTIASATVSDDGTTFTRDEWA